MTSYWIFIKFSGDIGMDISYISRCIVFIDINKYGFYGNIFQWMQLLYTQY